MAFRAGPKSSFGRLALIQLLRQFTNVRTLYDNYCYLLENISTFANLFRGIERYLKFSIKF